MIENEIDNLEESLYYAIENKLYDHFIVFYNRLILSNLSDLELQSLLNKLITLCCIHEQIDILKKIVSHPLSQPNHEEGIALIVSVQNSNSTIFKYLSGLPNAIFNGKKNKAIYIASLDKENIDIINILWEQESVKSTLFIDHPNLYQMLVKRDIKNKVNHF